MDYRTLRRLESLALFVLLSGCGYAGYQVYQNFSIGSLVMWGGLLVLYLAAFGWMLPDWSELEDMKDLYREVFDIIEAKKFTVYARELEAARQKLFETRDRLLRSRAVLQGVPIARIKEEMVETWEALKTAPAEKKAALEQRFQELEQTYALLSPNSTREEDFKEMKKNVLASLQHLRVRLAAQDGDMVGAAAPSDPTVEESFLAIHAIMDRVSKPVSTKAAGAAARGSDFDEKGSPDPVASVGSMLPPASESKGGSPSESPKDAPYAELQGCERKPDSSPWTDEDSSSAHPSSPPSPPVSRPERQ